MCSQTTLQKRNDLPTPASWAGLAGIGLSLAIGLGASALAAGPLKLHVPSPDWRDQIIYFVLTDRFADGNPRNNDQGAGEYDPRSPRHYSGGDLAGLAQHLDYIRGLGATALWVTPPVANLWRDPWAEYSGYHGYWAEHFKRVDKHLGTLDDYKRLSHALHSQGMYLVQDIVVNHTANFFDYRGGWDPADPRRFYVPTPAARKAPTQWPFKLNDPRRAADRRAGIYHWTPAVADYSNPVQEQTFQMGGLDDLATGNPLVRRALRDSYGFWVREVGVDAFRVDTAFYVEPAFFEDFMQARDRAAPGMAEVARRTGRQQFHVFGEGFAIDRPFEDTQARKIERYITGDQGQPRMPGMLNFPLYGAFNDVFARGRPPAELGHRIAATMRVHARPHLMVNFLDNHDVDRFLAGGSEAALRQALLALMTLPGIPVIYYGTEQGFTLPRAAMFAAGWGSGGRDRFDTAHPLYRYTAAVSALRRAQPVLSRGTPLVLRAAAAGPGALAWRMAHDGQTLLVVMNTADSEVLLDNLAPDAAPGTRLQPLFGIDGMPPAQMLDAEGRLTLRLPARSGWVWALRPPESAAAVPAAVPPVVAGPTLDPLPAAPQTGDFSVGGTASGPVQLVLDGQLSGAPTVLPAADGRWQATVDTAALMDPGVRHTLTAWDGAAGVGGAASATQTFSVQRDWTLLAEVDDPAGDDHGPGQQRYTYPSDPGFAARTMDLRRVRVFGAGGALRVELQMQALSTVWAPPNGFDHVAFTLYIELPGQPEGAAVMPLQDGSLPAAMRWHRRLRVHGWSNALFSAEGASASSEGTSISPAAKVEVDRPARTVTFSLPAAALGRLRSLSGAKLYVSTWDYDGGYRPLSPTSAPFSMGGGGVAGGLKVMDDLPVISLP
jgi:glycosidase